jgi:hypothetical protein
MPTEVAASIAPRNAWAIQGSPGGHHVLRGGLEADLQQEQDRPELGQDREGLARLERGDARAADEGEVAEDDAEEQLAEDGGLAHALDEGPEQLGPHEDDGEAPRGDAGRMIEGTLGRSLAIPPSRQYGREAVSPPAPAAGGPR